MSNTKHQQKTKNMIREIVRDYNLRGFALVPDEAIKPMGSEAIDLAMEQIGRAKTLGEILKNGDDFRVE